MSDICPNRCVDGYYIDPYTHKRKLCQHCLEKRRAEVKTAEIKDKLNLPPSLCGNNFNVENILLQNQRSRLESESVKLVLEEAEKLVRDISIGELPTESVLFNFGARCHDANFISPFLRKAYASGLTVLPLLTPIDIIRSRKGLADGENNDVISYDDIVSKQVCLVVLDSGSSQEDILAVKGVMQLRSLRNLPTVIITHVWNKTVSYLHDDPGFSSYELATLYSVKYLKTQDFSRENVSRLSLDDFKERKNVNI